jgi:4-hydroxy-tetrahydrodipicolinate reductase
MRSAHRYRVVQWSSGNVGRHAIRLVAGRDNLELVGLYVTNPAKRGEDAGTVAGLGALGVAATSEIEEILGQDADVVIHTPLPSMVYGDDPGADVDIFCRLLASGKNVITTVGYMYPQIYGPAVMDRLEEACAKGGTSFHGTGLNPGWMGDLFPLVLAGCAGTVDQISVREISNFQFYPSPEIMFDMMGFGRTVADFEETAERHKAWLDGLFTESVQMVADGLEAPVDGVSSQRELATAPHDLETAAGVVAEGTVAGQRWRWAATMGDADVVVHETVWRMHTDVAPDWPVGSHSVTVQGSPRLHVEFPPSFMADGLLATAAHAVNAIAYVCPAPPGVRTFLDLPLITAVGAVNGGRDA